MNASIETTDLVIQVTGEIQSSNFVEYKKEILKRINGIKQELKTDDDFAEAKVVVKQLNDAEKQMVGAKSEALKQAKDVYDLFDAIDEITEASRTARLELSKTIKTQNEKVKSDLVDASWNMFSDACKDRLEISEAFKLDSPVICTILDFRDAIKGKSSLKVIEKTLTDLANDKIDEIDEHTERLESNLTHLRSFTEYSTLFQDEAILIAMDRELLDATIKGRIATHKEALAQRELDEKNRIEAEKLVETQKEHLESRPPVVDEQDNQRSITPTGAGVIEPSTATDQAAGEASPAEINYCNTDESEIFLIQLQVKCEKQKAIDFYQVIAKSDFVVDSHLNRKIIIK